MKELLFQAIESVEKAKNAFCRYITGNDTGKTGSHQSGYYIPKEAAKALFGREVHKGENADKSIEIKWQDDFITDSRFIYYGTGSRNEFRITRFGRNFPFVDDECVGDLLIIAQNNEEEYSAYVLSSDVDIDGFFAYFNISPENINHLIKKEQGANSDVQLGMLLDKFVTKFTEFPATEEMASGARNCYNKAYNITDDIINRKPDEILLKWVDAEYMLFKKMEDKIYAPLLKANFHDVNSFVESANKILNRRKSRAGKSLEHHLSKVFSTAQLRFEEQVVTEENKRPDFIFPDGKCYHNFNFPANLLVSLAAKTTCKDRWRQVINEANRIELKHLFTLQQGISKNQLKEMADEHVQLVVPSKYISSFPKEYQPTLMGLSTFVSFVKEKQKETPQRYFVF